MRESDTEESRRAFLRLLLAGIGTVVAGTTAESMADQTSPQGAPALYESTSGDITMALAGDAMITRPLTPFREPNFLAVRDLLLRADVRFANGEMLFHNYENWPTDFTRTYTRCDPRYIKDLQWMGINLLSCANNHAIDYLQGGVLTNIQNLDEAGMVHAGTGSNYASAVAPAYLETPKGRVALVASTSTGQYQSRAGDQRRDMKGRPGVNLIRWINEWVIDKDSLDAFNRVGMQFGTTAKQYLGSYLGLERPVPQYLIRDYGVDKDKSAVHFADRNMYTEDEVARFVLGDSFQRHTKMHRSDYQRNLQSVGDARRLADWVIYSVHNHEYSGQNPDEPSGHIVKLAHAVIDAGADVFVGHGPHAPRGIEIYKGKPIFYSVGDFIFEPETVLLDPEDDYVRDGLGPENLPADVADFRVISGQHTTAGPEFSSVIPIVSFKNKQLREIRVYPIDLGAGLPRSESGRPMLMEGEVAINILQRLKRLCEPFQTRMDIRENVGVIQFA